jgi:hypothetical protein
MLVLHLHFTHRRTANNLICNVHSEEEAREVISKFAPNLDTDAAEKVTTWGNGALHFKPRYKTTDKDLIKSAMLFLK